MLLKLLKPFVTNQLFVTIVLIVLFVITVAAGPLYATLYDVYTSPEEIVELNLAVEMVNSLEKNCSTEFIFSKGEEYLVGLDCIGNKLKIFSLPKEDVDAYYKFILQE